MEINVEWQTQPSSSNQLGAGQNHFTSGQERDDRDQQPGWDSSAAASHEHFTNYGPSSYGHSDAYKSGNNKWDEKMNAKQERERSHSSQKLVLKKSFSDNDHIWLAETVDSENFLVPADNTSLTVADSSGLSDVYSGNSVSDPKRFVKHIGRQYSRLPSVSDDRLSEYESDDSDLSEVNDGDVTAQVPLGDSSSCNICGDVVAGFHCGAYVCEACKKFFVRCLKQDTGSKFTCSQNSQCVITKETRTQCPHCRYQKCLKLGMYKPGGPNLSSEIRHIPCKVCGAPSSGFHFGAITCEGCKGFFRRSVKERDCLKYQCTRNGSCNITSKTRNVCKMCRYRQCLRAGMKPDKSRIGRQPNAIKHATFVQLNRIKVEKGLSATADGYPGCEASMDGIDFGRNNMGMPFVEDTDSFDVTSSCFQRNFIGRKMNRKKQKRYRHVSEDLQFTDGSGQFIGAHEIKKESVSPLACEIGEGSGNEMDVLCLNSANAGDYIDWNRDAIDLNFSPNNLTSINISKRDLSNICKRVMGRSQENVPASIAVDDLDQSRCAMGNKQVISSASEAAENSELSSRRVDSDSIIACMKQAYAELEPLFSRASTCTFLTEDSSIIDVWDSMMAQFTASARSTLKFAKKVPGFRSFPINEQIAMVQACMFPIVAVVMSLAYKIEKRQLCWFNFTLDEQKIIFESFDTFRHLEAAMHVIGHVIHELDPDEIEVAFLCGIHLVDSGTQPIFKEQLVDALGEYTKYKSLQNGELRKGHILMCLRDMAEINQRHQETVALILADSKFSQLEVPQLFKETFVGMDDGF